LREKCPADEEPDGKQHSDRGRAEDREDHRKDQADPQSHTGLGQDLFVGGERARLAARVDVDHRNGCDAPHDREAGDGEDDAEGEGEEGDYRVRAAG
jgi:hypothetical protein